MTTADENKKGFWSFSTKDAAVMFGALAFGMAFGGFLGEKHANFRLRDLHKQKCEKQTRPVVLPKQLAEGVNDQLEPYLCSAYWLYTEETAAEYNNKWPDHLPRAKAGDVDDELHLFDHEPVWAYSEGDAAEVFQMAREVDDADKIECRRAECYMKCDTQQTPKNARRVYFGDVEPVIGSPVGLDSNEYGSILFQCERWAHQCNWEEWEYVDVLPIGYCPDHCRKKDLCACNFWKSLYEARFKHEAAQIALELEGYSILPSYDISSPLTVSIHNTPVWPAWPAPPTLPEPRPPWRTGFRM